MNKLFFGVFIIILISLFSCGNKPVESQKAEDSTYVRIDTIAPIVIDSAKTDSITE